MIVHHSPTSTLRLGASLLAAGLLTVTGLTAASPRVVAIGDLHGDAANFVSLLQHVGLIDTEERWSGGSTVLVQMGDYLDYGPDVPRVIELLLSIQTQASQAGGRAVVLMGNHEVMNALGDLREVAPRVFESFVDADSAQRREKAWREYVRIVEKRRSEFTRVDPKFPIPSVYDLPTREAWMEAHPPGWLEYRAAFGPNGRFGKWIRQHPIVEKIGDTVFVHAGLDPAFSSASLDQINDRARDEIRRFDKLAETMVREGIALPFFSLKEMIEAGRAEVQRAAVDTPDVTRRLGPQYSEDPRLIERNSLVDLLKIGQWSVLSPQGPLWFRGFATEGADEGKALLDRLQKTFGPVRFVVGHSPPPAHLKDRRVTVRFGDRVFLIDTDLSSFYKGGRPSALEIADGRYVAVTQEDRRVLVGAPETTN